jgi:divalent metal cation (Fe/Co/Zn/Cd) transporter
LRIEWLSVGWMGVEAGVGIRSGLAAHSLALTAFGADSVIELVAGGVLLWRLYTEARGAAADRIARVDRQASWVVGIALLALAGYLVLMAGLDLWTRTGAAPSGWGVGLAVTAAFIMPGLARAKRRIGRTIGSDALVADGSCSLVCAYMAWTLLVGLAATALWGWWWLNPLAGLVLVYWIVREGREAVEDARGHGTAESCRIG